MAGGLQAQGLTGIREDAGAADTTFNVEELPERAGATSAPDDPSSDDITQSKTQTAGARHA